MPRLFCRSMFVAVLVCLFALSSSAERPGVIDKADDLFGSMDGKLNLRFFDALTGDPVSGAKLTFRGKTRVTDRKGLVSFPKPTLMEPEVILKVQFAKDGYVQASIPLRFMVGELWRNRFSVSPVLPVDKLRVVLDWGESPADFDAHWKQHDGYHVSYRKMRHSSEAKLDRDDLDGFGPETITLNKPNQSRRYSYFVHNYTDRKSLRSRGFGKGRVQVKIYDSDQLLHHFDAPEKPGLIWRVFDVVDGQIKIINEVE